MVNQMDGYVENVLDPPEMEKIEDEFRMSEIGVWTYTGLAIAVVVFLGILSVTGWLYSRVQKLQDALTNGDIDEFMYGLSEEAQQQEGEALVQFALTFPYDKSYEIAKDKLKIKREALLGSGEYGCVYKALIGGEGNVQIEVALKMAKKNCPKTTILGLLSEIKTLIYLGKHPNIASIQGAYTARLSKGIVYLATELCAHGSLEDYLRKNPFHGKCDSRTISNYDKLEEKPRQSDYTFIDMVRWSHEIACGMEYLGLKQVIHADLATRNVLLDANKTAKITDFGLSRRLYDYTNYVKTQQEPLPWRWMSVESLKRLEFSEKSDVWSYGVALWEIFALGDIPYPGLSWNPEFVDFLVDGLRMKSPLHATPEIYEIMTTCWKIEAEERPSFSDLKLSTAKVLESFISTSDQTCDK